MANEDKKDFNAILQNNKDMPKIFPNSLTKNICLYIIKTDVAQRMF